MVMARSKPHFDFMPRILSREGAGYYLGISPNSLDKLPIAKIRPIGKRVAYDRQDLDEYIEKLKKMVPDNPRIRGMIYANPLEISVL
jgi:hypothetical protein